MSLNKGDRVLHRVHGPGTIEAKMGFGERRVRFDSQPTLPRTMPLKDLTKLSRRQETQVVDTGSVDTDLVETDLVDTDEIDASGTATAVEPEPAPATHPVPAARSVLTAGSPRPEALETTPIHCPTTWQTLEALRLGVVPAHGVEDYTVARDRELESIHALLEAGQGCRIIWGDYGAGKTHMLDVSERLALERGWATARVTLDPAEHALHHPLRLYKKIVDSVRTADSVGTGVDAIFERLFDSPEHYQPDGDRSSRFFSPYLHGLRNGRAEQILALRDYVRGEPMATVEVNQILHRLHWTGQGVLRMSDFRTFGRMYIYLIGTLAAWCGDAGLRGLLLFFDEVERVDALAGLDRRYAFEVLQHYAAVTIPRRDLAFDADALYRGGRGVHRALPLRFRDDQPLATVFALTPLPEIEQQFESVTENRKYDVWLGELHRGCLGDLVHRVAQLYHRAHTGYSVSKPKIAAIHEQIASEIDDGNDGFRAAVRATVFLLDADRCGTGPGIGASSRTGTADW